MLGYSLPRIAGDFKIGYARITQFNTPTAAELAKKLDNLEAQGMQAIRARSAV